MPISGASLSLLTQARGTSHFSYHCGSFPSAPELWGPAPQAGHPLEPRKGYNFDLERVALAVLMAFEVSHVQDFQFVAMEMFHIIVISLKKKKPTLLFHNLII